MLINFIDQTNTVSQYTIRHHTIKPTEFNQLPLQEQLHRLKCTQTVQMHQHYKHTYIAHSNSQSFSDIEQWKKQKLKSSSTKSCIATISKHVLQHSIILTQSCSNDSYINYWLLPIGLVSNLILNLCYLCFSILPVTSPFHQRKELQDNTHHGTTTCIVW